MARPTKLDADRQAKVCEALALGVSIEAAAAHAGLSAACVHEWMARGRKGERLYAEFLEATTRARDAAEVRFAAVVAKAAKEGSESAARWWLERRRPETWGRKDADVQVTTNVQQGANIAPLLERIAQFPASEYGDDGRGPTGHA
jgi:transposase